LPQQQQREAQHVESREIDRPVREGTGALRPYDQRPDADGNAHRIEPEGHAGQEVEPGLEAVVAAEAHLLERRVERLKEARDPALALRDAIAQRFRHFLDQRRLDQPQLFAIGPEAHADFGILDGHPGWKPPSSFRSDALKNSPLPSTQ
jgi:hypothetical protein